MEGPPLATSRWAPGFLRPPCSLALGRCLVQFRKYGGLSLRLPLRVSHVGKRFPLKQAERFLLSFLRASLDFRCRVLILNVFIHKGVPGP